MFYHIRSEYSTVTWILFSRDQMRYIVIQY